MLLPDTAAPTRTAKPEALPNLTSARFAAALLVVLFHCRNMLPGSPLRPLVLSGYVGVSFFFVLSGFILAYNYQSVVRRDFYVARFARIYPVYFVGAVFALLVAVCIRHRAPWSAVLPALLLLQSWIPSLATALNGPGWSLSTEAFFYLAFPSLVDRLRGVAAVRAFVIMAATWSAGLVAPLIYSAYVAAPLTIDDGTTVTNLIKFNPLSRLPDFVVGVTLGCLFVRTARKPRAALALVAAIGIGIGLVVAPRLPYLAVHNGLFVPAFAALIFALASTDVPWLRGRIPLLLGEASYSLYILHLPILAVMEAYEDRVHVFGRALQGAYVVVSIVVSIVCYQRIELPMRARVRRWLSPRRSAG